MTQLFSTVCESLRTHLPRELHRIGEAMHARKFAEVREVAHRVAGMISAVSTSAAATASALEEEAACEDFVEAATLFEHLARQTHAIVKALALAPPKTSSRLAARAGAA